MRKVPYMPITMEEKEELVEIFRAAYLERLAKEAQKGGSAPPLDEKRQGMEGSDGQR